MLEPRFSAGSLRAVRETRSMPLNRRSFITVTSLLSTLAVLPWSRAGAQSRTPISIGVLPPSDISAEPYYAAAQGFFPDAGLDATIEPLPNASAIISAAVSGHFDVAYSNMITLAIARDRGIESVILAPANLHVHRAPTAGILAVAKRSPIVSAKDLSGKLVAVEGLNNIAEIATRDWIDKNGGDSKSVKFVEITLAAMSAAILAGRVDAAVMNAIFDTTAGKPDDPFRRLCSSTFDAISPAFAPSVWFATPSWVAAHPQSVLGFIRAMRRTAVWANQHHDESAAILARYTKQSVAAIEGVRRVTYGEGLTPGLIQPPIDVAAKYGLVKGSYSAIEMIAKAALAPDAR